MLIQKLHNLFFGYTLVILIIALSPADCKDRFARRNAVILTTAQIPPLVIKRLVNVAVLPAVSPVPLARAVTVVPQPKPIALPKALPTGFYTIPVMGSDRLKYYYTNVYVGTPPQPQSVIIDTGSDYLAFPCSTCISGKCGKHNNPPLNMQTNTTAKPVKCGEKIGNFVCGKYCNSGQCAFKRSY